MREALQERGEILLEQFSARCDERGVRADTQLATGIVANEICEQARTADLVVVGHRGVNEQFSTGLLGGTTESVTRKCPKPVLVSPMRVPADHAAAARLRRQPARGRGHARGRRARDRASGCRSRCCTSARTRRRPRKVLDEARRYLGHSPGRGRVRDARPGYANEAILDVMARAASTTCSFDRRLRPQPHHRDGARQHDRVRAAQRAPPPSSSAASGSPNAQRAREPSVAVGPFVCACRACARRSLSCRSRSARRS